MAGQVLPGKIIGVTINDTAVPCQIDATFSSSIDLIDSPPCKPGVGESYKSAQWSDSTAGARSWTIDFSGKAFADAVEFNNADILELIIDGDPVVQIQFATIVTTDYDFDQVLVISGEGIISDYTWNAPVEDESTYDVTVTGKGKPTFTRLPATS